MKKIFTIAVFVFCRMLSSAQTDSVFQVKLQYKFPGSFLKFTTDNLGNTYLLNDNFQLKKINNRGDSVGVYNDVKRFGNIYSIDAGNPLKVLVFYKDFSTIVVLDRQLNVRNTIDLRKANILQARAISVSYDNHIWLFDEVDNKVKKIDDNGKVLLAFTDFRQVYNEVPSPVSIQDRDGLLYLYDPKKGLYIFDYYGAQKKQYSLLGLKDIQVLDKNTITARDSSHIVLFKPNSLQNLQFKVFEKLVDYPQIHFDGNKIYALKPNGELLVYGLQ